MFSTTNLLISTDATSDVEIEVGFDACVPSRDSGDCAYLEDVVEVTLEDGRTLSFKELQAAGYRTLAHEIALELEDKIYDISSDLCEERARDAEDYYADCRGDR